MSATIKVGDLEATVDDGEWRSKNKDFAKTCDGAAWQIFPVEYEPDPDLAAATRAAKALGGTVIKSDTPEATRAGRVY